tara:strand:- start:45 stop:716 length:672 start_codon:yes stop_codon:yes gene_type:complete
MRIESKLCHLSDSKAVVKVNGWMNDKNLGSALAEGSTVEDAEDKAIYRLNKRLNILNNKEININENNEDKIKSQTKVEIPKSEKIVPVEVDNGPSDWSKELTAIDSEIERLNWSRNDEAKFLANKFGYNNRYKITKYSELINYLNMLKKINNLDLSKKNETSIKTMIKESDEILRELSWDNKQGREYLQKEFKVSTRKELDEKQLISFLDNLKTIRKRNLTNQ